LSLRRKAGLLVALLATAAGASACRKREPPDHARERMRKQVLEKQLVELEELRGKAERGELVRADQIAVSIGEKAATEILNVPLPREQVIAGRARVRLEQAVAYFRGNQAILLFKARAQSEDWKNAYADLELAGGLDDVELSEGRLRARVQLVHFTVLEASVGTLAVGVVERLVRDNLQVLQGAIPPFEVPVRLDEQIALTSFEEGPVSARGGALPLAVQVAQVLNINERMWILLDVKAGPWKAARP
jgi:hypothetical protein